LEKQGSSAFPYIKGLYSIKRIIRRLCIIPQEQVFELKAKREAGVIVKDLMEEYGLSKTTIYRLLGKAI